MPAFAQSPDGRKYLDRSNIQYGRLTAVSLSHFNERDQAYWNCSCECGNKAVVFGGNLTSGQTKSCGCLANEGNNFKHGHARDLRHSKEYDCWICMKARVLNPKNKRYADYGGRGITICERWKTSFGNFFADMGTKPSPQHSIHRKNNDGPYSPENCKWATDEQNWFKRTSRNIEFRGEVKCASEWSKITGISVSNIYARLRLGWDAERILTTPVKVHA